ncbi:SDR family NAD(P)-dependent oxidoreductase [Pseudarthrobacter psychrotolerans]|uniref:SDR family NAD(P)-dependent oxidoreductase n=1 Tax=Pseudarthrobacter psychrotolerans TaxID=2697569 RepID=A0A6P1NIG4_9MICC|nr:SDR family NAD(P)-dependent oxidoreductase [Pseudarthrobacter psychrotolerans]QHK18913.1 SDR family NAD(P)-dependent oxidoreductase [Pseudarthrobacter psychrotolerans]
MSKTWFITGASRGFGRRFAEAALSRGDRVAATARRADTLTELVETYGDAVLPLQLDVTDRAEVARAVARTHEHFGALDVVVNNAGYGLFGALEELTEAEVRAQFETNVFGSLWVAQAALPYLREQRSGHIIMLSSMLGIAAFPTTGGYTASKAAVEGLADSLSQEVAGFGIKVTVVQPGAFATDFGTSSSYSAPLAEYDEVRNAFMSGFADVEIGDPDGVGPAILKLVDAENPPLRVFFGTPPLQLIPHIYGTRLEEWNEWAWLSAEAEKNQTATSLT